MHLRQWGGPQQTKAQNIPQEEGQASSTGTSPKITLPAGWAKKLPMEEGSKEIHRTAEARMGACPVCQEPQVYNRRMSWGSLSWPSSRLQDCGAFIALSPSQRDQGNRGGKRMCDVLILDTPKLKVSLEGTKDSQPGNGQLEVPRKRSNGYLWTSPPQNVTWKHSSVRLGQLGTGSS